MAEIVQADRDAYADYCAIPGVGEYENSIAQRVRDGFHEDPLLRAFAKHREQAELSQVQA